MGRGPFSPRKAVVVWNFARLDTIDIEQVEAAKAQGALLIISEAEFVDLPPAPVDNEQSNPRRVDDPPMADPEE